MLDSNIGIHLTVSKKMSFDLFKNNVTYKLFIYELYIFNI